MGTKKADDSERSLKVLASLCQALNRRVEVQPLTDVTLSTLCSLLDAPAGWITLQDGSGQMMTVASQGFSAPVAALFQADDTSFCACEDRLLRSRTSRARAFSTCTRLLHEGFVSHGSVILQDEGKVFGTLNLASRDPAGLSPPDLDILTVAAPEVAAALSRVLTLKEVLRSKKVRDSALLEYTSGLVGLLEPQEIMDRAVTMVAKTLDVPLVGLRRLDDTADGLTLMAGVGWASDRMGSDRISLANPTDIIALAARSREPVLSGEGPRDPHLSPQIQGRGMACQLTAPLITGKRLIGTLSLASPIPGRLGQAEVPFVSLVADQTALALDRAVLLQETRRQLNDLTRIYRQSERQTRELADSYGATLAALGGALELRDEETAGHTDRVVGLASALGKRLGLTAQEIVYLEWGAYVHDLGKIGIPDAILRKPGPLTADERTHMETHPGLGHQLLRPLGFLSHALDVVLYHHERYDGMGYPQGLKGQDIPFMARIFAVVDAYDAMTSNRPYRRAMAHELAMEEIARHRGTQFDPEVADTLAHLPPEVLGEALARSARLPGGGDERESRLQKSFLKSIQHRDPVNLLGLAGTLMQSDSLEATLDRILVEVETLFGAKVAAVLLLDEETRELYFVAQRGYSQEIVQTYRFRVEGGKGIVTHVVRTGQPYYTPDATKDPVYIDGSHGIMSEVAYPLIVDDRVIGVLDVESFEKDAFPAPVRLILDTFAALVALAIHRVRKEEELQRLAHTDSLTGLANRRAFSKALAKEISRSKRHSHPLSLIMVEVDRFKKVNDRFGHLKGDALLRGVAKTLQAACRESDMAARTGGDEFVLLLPETPKAAAVQAAERIRAQIAEVQLSDRVRMSASIGVAGYPEDGDRADGLYEAADKAMYRAKRRGGNLVKVAIRARRSSVGTVPD